MWSRTSLRAKRISGPGKFRSSPSKDFCNTICHKETHAPQQTARRIGYPHALVLQLGNSVFNLICIAGTDNNVSAFNGERVCTRASNVQCRACPRARQHFSSQTKSIRISSVDPHRLYCSGRPQRAYVPTLELSDRKAELEQLAVKARRSPKWILNRKHFH
jgi:hypothetical protein